MAGWFKAARAARKQQQDFAELLSSPGAYRPGGFRHDRSGVSTDEVLHRLADVANSVGLTAGDAGRIATAFVRRVDHYRSYDEAIVALLRAIEAGQVETVSGEPLRQYATPDAVVTVCEATATVARPEALSESMHENDDEVPRGRLGQAMINSHVESLLADYRFLRSQEGLLLTEAEQMKGIREELLRYGVDPEEQDD